MASSASTKWDRFKWKAFWFLYKVCPAGNFHGRWDRLCFCRLNEHDGHWHGGIYDFTRKCEYKPCHYCEAELVQK